MSNSTDNTRANIPAGASFDWNERNMAPFSGNCGSVILHNDFHRNSMLLILIFRMKGVCRYQLTTILSEGDESVVIFFTRTLLVQ